MRPKEYTKLKFVGFRYVGNWSVSHILGQRIGFNEKYLSQPIGSFVKRSSVSTNVRNECQYKQVTLKTKGGGAVLRDIKLGKDIGTKKQYVVSEGQFIMSKIDARNGAFGIVPNDLDGAIVTADFPLFDIETDIINPVYFSLISSTNAFARFAQSCSRGTTNRQRIDINLFLSQQVPLPTLSEQQTLVKTYNDKIQQAELLERQANQVEKEIEEYLLKELGISGQKKKENSQYSGFKFLKFIKFKDANRWDVYNGEPEVILRLKQSSFPLVEIGKAYNFTKRSWDKKEKEFRYVEIGSVDTLNGIMYAEKIPTSKAPSRATQKIKTKDLIIGTTRPYLKKFAIVNQDFDDCVCSSGFQVIAPNETNNISFLYEYLMTTPAIAQFELFMTGALYPAITNKDLKKVLIPLPTLEIQNAIVEHINKQKVRIKELKKQAEELRKEALVEFEKEIFE
ncbi:MAG: restriction endonuclease subunit S [Bacteroidales bacterium]|nr:restriction endonuclease subunit S [Bacteroidales bacterium]